MKFEDKDNSRIKIGDITHILKQKTEIKRDSLWSWEGKVILPPREMEHIKSTEALLPKDKYMKHMPDGLRTYLMCDERLPTKKTTNSPGRTKRGQNSTALYAFFLHIKSGQDQHSADVLYFPICL